MQQQHQQTPQPPTLNSGTSFSPNAITTEQIQKCLDDNKNLILAILENQNLGKFQECAQYQAILQKNLMYLAAIADAQPPTTQSQPSIPSQMPPNSMPQQANSFMQQHQQPATPQQGGGSVVPKLPFQLNALRTQDQQQQLLQFQQQQLQAQMGLRPNGMLGMHQAMQSAMAGNPGALMDGRGGMKQDGSEAASGGDGQGKSRGGRDS
ncbi:GRF1-interacting factor 2-like [Cynara cardunculus var. scolymus]|uniref:GRF1-interacting factor 2-like n=1 Tax=Cynara cardunculus var. scolymus TaxID=59895 RepID=UPI000D625CE7|nr:GRF1-interacting factor 2-like [Cynara cardunculus var. scolymus]